MPTPMPSISALRAAMRRALADDRHLLRAAQALAGAAEPHDEATGAVVAALDAFVLTLLEDTPAVAAASQLGIPLRTLQYARARAQQRAAV